MTPSTDLTWNDLFSYVTGDPEQFGGQTGFNRGQYRQMIERFDRNRNRRPDADEVARFLFRDSGVDVAFRLIGTDYYREINRSSHCCLPRSIQTMTKDLMKPNWMRRRRHCFASIPMLTSGSILVKRLS